MFSWKIPVLINQTRMYSPCYRLISHQFAIEYSQNGETNWKQVAIHTQGYQWTTTSWKVPGAYKHWRYRLLKKSGYHAPWFSGIEWFRFREGLSSNVAHHFNNKEFSDVTFVIKKKEIHVHKLILSMRSSYMAKMFNGSWKESKSNRIEINAFSYNVFYAYLRFLYTDCLIAPHIIDVLELADLARNYCQYQLYLKALKLISRQISNSRKVFFESLVNIATKAKALRLDCVVRRCDRALANYPNLLRVNTILSWPKICAELGLSELELKCIDFLKKNAKSVLFSAQFFKEIQSEEFQAVLKNLLLTKCE